MGRPAPASGMAAPEALPDHAATFTGTLLTGQTFVCLFVPGQSGHETKSDVGIIKRNTLKPNAETTWAWGGCSSPTIA